MDITKLSILTTLNYKIVLVAGKIKIQSLLEQQGFCPEAKFRYLLLIVKYFCTAPINSIGDIMTHSILGYFFKTVCGLERL
jgi:hypothetical protein